MQALNAGDEELPEWGPSEHELANARHVSLVASVVEGDTEDITGLVDADDIDDDLGFEEEEDMGLADALDAVTLLDNSRREDDDVSSDDEY